MSRPFLAQQAPAAAHPVTFYDLNGNERPWSVSVVIPVLNGEAELGRTIEAVLACELPPNGTLEVVVADDGSDDRTVAIARSFGGPIRVETGPRSGPAAVRNLGAQSSRGDILLFLDCGDMPSTDWLTQVVWLFKDPNVGLASWPAGITDVPKNRRVNQGPGRDDRGGVLSVAGSFAVRRSVFDDVGGYDPHLRYGENSDLFERACAQCRRVGLGFVTGDVRTIEVFLGKTADHYDCHRLSAAEHLLQRDCGLPEMTSDRRGLLHSIASVNAARCHDWPRARRHAWDAVRARPAHLRAYARLVVALVPPLADRLWAAKSRRRRAI